MDLQVFVGTTDVLAAVVGRFDAHGVAHFTEQVTDRIGPETPNLSLDLSEVEFMDSSALAALVRALQRTMRHDGVLALMAVSPAAKVILELTRLDQIFPVTPVPAGTSRAFVPTRVSFA
ncbi:STAS domain-containing protein [Amnibacterium kyonggiense]